MMEKPWASAGAAPNQPGNGDGEWLYVLDGQGDGATAAHPQTLPPAEGERCLVVEVYGVEVELLDPNDQGTAAEQAQEPPK